MGLKNSQELFLGLQKASCSRTRSTGDRPPLIWEQMTRLLVLAHIKGVGALTK